MTDLQPRPPPMRLTDKPTFSDDMFCQRFRMRRRLFLCNILEAVVGFNESFLPKCKAAGQLGFSHQKIMAEFRMLAYGESGDSLDEYICMVIFISCI